VEEDLVSTFRGSMHWKIKALTIGNRERAFASNEFKDYNPRVEYHATKLVEVIRKTEGKEVNAQKLMENMVFDM
jgi:23S rRNA pseudoU1915 N3-methylase RlmH